jgi:hypothetical protein
VRQPQKSCIHPANASIFLAESVINTWHGGPESDAMNHLIRVNCQLPQKISSRKKNIPAFWQLPLFKTSLS